MWKFVALVLVLQNFGIHAIDILRCCKDHESVVLSRYGNINNIECQSSGEKFDAKIVSRNDNRVIDNVPFNWNFQYSIMPECPDSYELSFIRYKINNYNRTDSHYKLYDDGILKLYLRGEEVIPPSGYCLANNAIMACRPYMPVTRRIFKKCCGQNGVIRDTMCANNDKQRWSMVEDLNDLLKIKNDYFKINNIAIESGFPYCPDKDLTLSHAAYYMYQSDASVVLDGSHAIAQGEFCIERERFDSGDHIAVYTCAKDAHSPPQNYNMGPGFKRGKLRKCCRANEVLKNSMCVSEETSFKGNMTENLRQLLQISNKYLDNVDVISSYPTCRDINYNTHKLFEYELRGNASIKLNNESVIPSEEYCLERDRTYGRDVAVVLTCSNYVDRSEKYVNSAAVMSNNNAPKTFRKCCQENYLLKNFTCMSGDIQRAIESDLSDLINNDNDYFNINNIHVASGYPSCPNNNWNFTRVNYMHLEFLYDASVKLNHHHVIPADQFCLDRDRIYGKDYMTLVTCPEYAYGNSHAVRSNIHILAFFIFLHFAIKLML